MPLRSSVRESVGELEMFLRTPRAEVTRVAWERREARWISETRKTTVAPNSVGVLNQTVPDLPRPCWRSAQAPDAHRENRPMDRYEAVRLVFTGAQQIRPPLENSPTARWCINSEVHNSSFLRCLSYVPDR